MINIFAILFQRETDYEHLTSVVEFKPGNLTQEEEEYLEAFAREMTEEYLETTPVPRWAAGGPFRHVNVLSIRKRKVQCPEHRPWLAKKNTWDYYEQAHTLQELTNRFVNPETGRYSL